MVVLAAVGEKHNPDRIIQTANDLAQAYDEELQVLHVIPSDDAEAHFEELRSIPEFRDFSFEVEVERAEEIADTLVEGALGGDASGVTPVGRVGEPTEQILHVASATDPRYLVIGGRKRSPAGKALFGSVTQSVILNADRPVVTVMTD